MLIDIIFVVLMLLACYKGYHKGFIIALFSVVAIIAGLAAALKLSAVAATYISANSNAPGRWLPVLSFLVVFIIVVFLVNIGARLLQKSVELMMLGLLNRLCGIILYVFLYSMLYSILLFYADQLHFIKTGTRDSSLVFPYVQPLGPWVINGLGRVIPVLKDIFAQLENFFSTVSNKIQH